MTSACSYMYMWYSINYICIIYACRSQAYLFACAMSYEHEWMNEMDDSKSCIPLNWLHLAFRIVHRDMTFISSTVKSTMTNWRHLAKSRTCWHNCQASSQSGHLCTEPDMKTLQISRSAEEMSASQPGWLRLKVGKTFSSSMTGRGWQNPDLCHWRIPQTHVWCRGLLHWSHILHMPFIKFPLLTTACCVNNIITADFFCRYSQFTFCSMAIHFQWHTAFA